MCWYCLYMKLVHFCHMWWINTNILIGYRIGHWRKVLSACTWCWMCYWHVVEKYQHVHINRRTWESFQSAIKPLMLLSNLTAVDRTNSRTTDSIKWLQMQCAHSYEVCGKMSSYCDWLYRFRRRHSCLLDLPASTGRDRRRVKLPADQSTPAGSRCARMRGGG